MSTVIDTMGMRWLHGFKPERTIRECDHDCPHSQRTTIAFGPDVEHSMLVRCDTISEIGGCEGRCRGWVPTDPATATAGPSFGWKQVHE